MTTNPLGWMSYLLITLVIFGAVAFGYRLLGDFTKRREQRRRIVAARIRSGHVPLDVPTTTRGDLARSGDPASAWGQLGDGDDDEVIVDERPRIHIRYLDIYGKPVQRTIDVEKLDLHRQALIAKGDSLHDPRVFPLDRITEARNAVSGKAFNIGQWVDAVRVARHRREIQEESQMGVLA